MPEPGQLERIRHLRIEAPASACPGKALAATYDGQLDDGSWLPHRLPPELVRLEIEASRHGSACGSPRSRRL